MPYHPSTEDDLRYGDVGPILAKAILAHPALQKIELYPLPRPSGRPLSEQAVTPLRLAEPFLTQWTSCLSKMCRSSMCCRTTRGSAALEESIKRQLPLFMPEGKPELVAVSITGEEHTGFAAIQELATALIRGAESIIAAKLPLIIISKNDIGKALDMRSTFSSSGARLMYRRHSNN